MNSRLQLKERPMTMLMLPFPLAQLFLFVFQSFDDETEASGAACAIERN